MYSDQLLIVIPGVEEDVYYFEKNDAFDELDEMIIKVAEELGITKEYGPLFDSVYKGDLHYTDVDYGGIYRSSGRYLCSLVYRFGNEKQYLEVTIPDGGSSMTEVFSAYHFGKNSSFIKLGDDEAYVSYNEELALQEERLKDEILSREDYDKAVEEREAYRMSDKYKEDLAKWEAEYMTNDTPRSFDDDDLPF